ncbi:hypothetical protein MKW98_030527 [Papaver atlanticum]|uniref:Uncharacterized protein n=1 Tax=Papaver atlanticum TaxID=357466 RepID=A0AAD4XS06_9MAGN|nr:hypothetical protein MKW98_030527 [Papaver atlanticum]
MGNLKLLDVRNNHLSSKIPSLTSNVIVLTSGNPDIGKDMTAPPLGSSDSGSSRNISKKLIRVIVGSVIGGVFIIVLLGVICFCLYNQKQGDTHVNEAKDMV